MKMVKGLTIGFLLSYSLIAVNTAIAENKGSDIPADSPLYVGDYMVAPNHLYYVILEGDGNLVVYRGAGPENRGEVIWAHNQVNKSGPFFAILQGADANLVVYQGTPSATTGVVWASGKRNKSGPFFLNMQDDGNLAVYKGTGPGNAGDTIWSHHHNLDKPVSISDISSISYDLSKANIVKTDIAELYSRQYVNNSSLNQSEKLSWTEETTDSSSWSNTVQVKVEGKADVQCGIPLVVGGKVETSVGVTETYVNNGSHARKKAWTVDEPLVIPAGKRENMRIRVSNSLIRVPYTATATVKFKSGKRIPSLIYGTYEGINSHDLEVTLEEFDAVKSVSASLGKTIVKSIALPQ